MKTDSELFSLQNTATAYCTASVPVPPARRVEKEAKKSWFNGSKAAKAQGTHVAVAVSQVS